MISTISCVLIWVWKSNPWVLIIELEYLRYVEASLSALGTSFKLDVLLLVMLTIPYHDSVPLFLGTNVLDLTLQSLLEDELANAGNLGG